MKHVFLTGHTGFKGTWLLHVLATKGIKVSGFSLPEVPGSLFDQTNARDILSSETLSDIRNHSRLAQALSDSGAETLVHFAAQPLVLAGYANPRETFEVNVLGTLNVIEAARNADIENVLIITTDKVYRDMKSNHPYPEDAALGGYDPYSASKASADLLSQSYGNLLSQKINLKIARGGNVIGGGDYADNRLVPDVERSITQNHALLVRNPNQVRPWQHVLDCLDGYLRLIERKAPEPRTWNVGPDKLEAPISVSDFLDIYLRYRQVNVSINYTPSSFHESENLMLDTTLISENLNWQPKLSTEVSIRYTAEWYKQVSQGQSPTKVTQNQIQDFLAMN